MLPYVINHQGAVLNFAIDSYVKTRIGHNPVSLSSGSKIENGVRDWMDKSNPSIEWSKKINAGVRSDLEGGNGLGSSSATTVSLVGVHWGYQLQLVGDDHKNIENYISRHKIATTAFKIEREYLQMAGGAQDQFASAYGGVNLMTFGPGKHGCPKEAYGAVVYPLRLDEHVIEDINDKLLILMVGKHNSADKIEEQQDEYGAHKVKYYDRAVKYAWLMTNSLVQGKMNDFYRILSKTHENKIRFARGITTPGMDEIYEIVMANHALACRVQGAGGGGSMLVMAEPRIQDKIIDATDHLCCPIKARIDTRGVKVWAS